eukprot:992995-Rhodomonas_salina.1
MADAAKSDRRSERGISTRDDNRNHRSSAYDDDGAPERTGCDNRVRGMYQRRIRRKRAPETKQKGRGEKHAIARRRGEKRSMCCRSWPRRDPKTP